MTALIVIVVLAVLIIGWIVMTYNRLIALRTQVANGWAQIDVQLKRRYDLIPNLVESVKGYMGHEQDTLRQVIEARNKAVAANPGGNPGSAPATAATAATIAAESALTASLGKMFALAESYPDLKANQSVQQLMEELATTENKIGFARQYYNDTATSLNTAVQSFPGNIIAGKFGFQNAELWRVSESERAAVEAAPKVSLR
jgi:LemA protein